MTALFCLGSYSDAVDIIKNENGISNTTYSKENTNCLDNIISEEYDDEEIIPQLPPVDAKLAVVITKWLHVLPPPMIKLRKCSNSTCYLVILKV